MIRPATKADSAQAIDVVRRSIEVLCVADHRKDRATLERWLANKTQEMFESWIANPENFCVVAEVGGRVRGVGLLRRSGELLLFYVDPGHQRSGLGRGIHAALEEQARSWGLDKLHLESTATARPFYEALGYRSAGPETSLFGVLRAYPCEKAL
jgi:GNAT superfamily N-acetyltransferase